MSFRFTYQRFIVQATELIFVLLFVYAAISKILDAEQFRLELGKSPLLSNYGDLIALGIPSLEIATSIFLLIPRTKFLALHGALSLMVAFTTYIFLILNFTNHIPCSCGGVLDQLGWTEHLIFNLFFISLAILALLIYKPQ